VAYEVNGGRIRTWSLEAHVVDHCNLRCANCCTRSPFLAERFVDPAAFERDLARARTVLAPELFKLTGGEPLLHPRLVELLEIARASEIAPRISITTNGLLARQAPDRVWELVDRVSLSLYPSAPLPEVTLAHLELRSREFGFLLVKKHADRFQQIDPPPGTTHDASTARAIHAACWLRHRCHLLHEGRFTCCTRPPHLGADLAARDGVSLDSPDLLGEVLRHLERDEPLASCRLCLGSSGPWHDHHQLAITTGSG
jgi:hypothetical protein